MATDDEVLLKKAVSGDAEALGALLLRVGPPIEEQIKREISAKHQSVLDAADVIQVTYQDAILRIRHFEPKGVGGFVRWLEQIAKNNLIDAIRGLESEIRPPPEKRVALSRGDDTYVPLLENLLSTGTTPSGPAKKSEAKERLEAALARLPKDYERVVRMLDLEGRPVEEVAQSLGRSKGAVHMLRARAYDRLKELLGSTSLFFTDSPVTVGGGGRLRRLGGRGGSGRVQSRGGRSVR